MNLRPRVANRRRPGRDTPPWHRPSRPEERQHHGGRPGSGENLDFGIAKQTEGETAGLTAGDRIFGTPEYMSPEQVEGGAADARSDVYALGCVVFEIFTGQPPFQGETPYATLLKHLKEPPPLDDAAVALPGRLRPCWRGPWPRIAPTGSGRRTSSWRRFERPGTPTHKTHSIRSRSSVARQDAPPGRRWAWQVGVGGAVAIGILFGVTRGILHPERAPSPGTSPPPRLSPSPTWVRRRPPCRPRKGGWTRRCGPAGATSPRGRQHLRRQSPRPCRRGLQWPTDPLQLRPPSRRRTPVRRLPTGRLRRRRRRSQRPKEAPLP